MAFKDFPDQEAGVSLLQRSLERGRLGHAYLFTAETLDALEALARTLAKTLNCVEPVLRGGQRVDCCDACSVCQKIESRNHTDIHWIRPESKLRVITIDQIRAVMHEVHLKPDEAHYKVGILVAADRLHVQAANAFLKTLEEPPVRSVLILLSTEPHRLLDTIRSRCLQVQFGGRGWSVADPESAVWLARFGEMVALHTQSLLDRYRLLGMVVQRLGELRASIESTLEAESPLARYPDADKEMRDQWHSELAAAIEAEYRHQRAGLLAAVQMWFRDVWLRAMGARRELMAFADSPHSETVARRISPEAARENLRILDELQRLLATNVQEALALEVAFLKLRI